ncbi:alpha/beta fold hydrolase [Streptomyces aurantiacus]|uniref:Putative Tripeptidyl aminopeptidase n=1 Tax=Streptomyces aurantiacus JA 4570 TaxID=1286094 RepID=S4AWH4_9ACTN|nr:alpha/beta fold hydrolase [Streptomyces aurantiacus]EPH45807.1 putative Tripeptidyl aminopeptidase [Streptomyces aurantiacus JA 4570]
MRATATTTAGLGLAAVLAGGLPAHASTAQGSSERPAAPAGTAALAKYERQRPDWGPCPAAQKELNAAGARCARVTVPLDYADPDGRTIEIAVSRVKATAPAGRRRGALLTNPGGPGGTGLAHTLALRPALKGVAGRYDLIGFDPRFLGDSTPIVCGPARKPPPPGPTTSPREDFEASVRTGREDARRCHEHGDNRALLPHASSRNVARDMDVIRAALGQRKLSYYGVSYGADLGATYTQMFPRRVDRFVVDSVTDPAATQYEQFRRSGAPAERALDEWAAWTARHHATYRLGRTAAQVRAHVEKLLTHAERRPLTVAGQRLTAPLLRMILKQPLTQGENDATTASLVRDLVAAGQGELTEPGPELAAMLKMLNSPEAADSMLGGTLFMCGDGGWPAGGWPDSTETYWKNSVRSRATEPVFGPFVNGLTAPCLFFEQPPREPAVTVDNDVPVLMLQAKRDHTRFADALAMHRALRGSRLVATDIRAHGVYGRAVEGLTRVPCADRSVNAYLGGGALPERDVECPAPATD